MMRPGRRVGTPRPPRGRGDDRRRRRHRHGRERGHAAPPGRKADQAAEADRQSRRTRRCKPPPSRQPPPSRLHLPAAAAGCRAGRRRPGRQAQRARSAEGPGHPQRRGVHRRQGQAARLTDLSGHAAGSLSFDAGPIGSIPQARRSELDGRDSRLTVPAGGDIGGGSTSSLGAGAAGLARTGWLGWGYWAACWATTSRAAAWAMAYCWAAACWAAYSRAAAWCTAWSAAYCWAAACWATRSAWERAWAMSRSSRRRRWVSQRSRMSIEQGDDEVHDGGEEQRGVEHRGVTDPLGREDPPERAHGALGAPVHPLDEAGLGVGPGEAQEERQRQR